MPSPHGMKRFLPEGTSITYTAWRDRKNEWHEGEPPNVNYDALTSVQVHYVTPNGKNGYFVVHGPIPGRGSVSDRLDRLASLLGGHVDYYTNPAERMV